MAEPYRPPRRFEGIERKVKRFFVMALIGLAGVIILVSYKQGLFVRHTPLHFFTADALGISKGMAIRLFGLQVGVVNDLLITDRGVKVEISITEDHLRRIAKGSRIKLARESYIGSASLQIMSATRTGLPFIMAQAGDELEFVTGLSIVDIVDDLKGQVTPLVNDMRGVLAEFSRPEGDYRRSIKAASEFLLQLPATNQDARRVLKSADHALLVSESTFGSVTRISAQVEQQLPMLADKLGVTMDAVSQTAGQLREVTRVNGEALQDTLRQIPPVVSDTGELIRDTNRIVREAGELMQEGRAVVGAVRQVWPIRTLVEPRNTGTLAIDSFESAASSRPGFARVAQP